MTEGSAPVNAYAQFGLAMCLLVGIALAGTAWLAAHFNRKAKQDLAARLTPLADAIGGEVDLEEAKVTGRWQGAIAEGQMANAQGGFGRLFKVSLVDAAGGTRWEWSNLPQKNEPEPTRTFDGGEELEGRLGLDWTALAAVVPEATKQRWGWIYDPESGMVQLARAMRTRHDIPGAEEFTAQLDALRTIGEANRRAQASA